MRVPEAPPRLACRTGAVRGTSARSADYVTDRLVWAKRLDDASVSGRSGWPVGQPRPPGWEPSRLRRYQEK